MDAIDLWILAGQSNMQGAGLLSDPARSPLTDPRVLAFGSNGEWGRAEDPLHRLWESCTPVHRELLREQSAAQGATFSDAELAEQQRVSPYGVGLGLSFGVTMAEHLDRRIGLIPAAHGGTSLAQWEPGHGGRADGSDATLYGAMMLRARRALDRPGTRLAGILWYQGESDTNPELADSYGDRLRAWVSRVRADLGDEELPFYAVQVGRFVGLPETPELDRAQFASSWNRVREQLRLLPEHVAHSGVVSAIDLGLSDTIHIDTPGLERLGRRLARLALDGGSAPRIVSVRRGGVTDNGFLTVEVETDGSDGAWSTTRDIRGFQLVGEDGEKAHDVDVVEARVLPDGRTIQVITTAVLDAALSGVFLGYGLGLSPDSRLADGADMPLPAFGPLRIADARSSV